MRVEWADSFSRFKRWEEERQLVLEEMRRVLAFQEAMATWWMGRGVGRPTANEAVREGLLAYAAKQADTRLEFGTFCAGLWKPVLAQHNLDITSWPAYAQDAPVIASRRKSRKDAEDAEDDDESSENEDLDRSDTESDAGTDGASEDGDENADDNDTELDDGVESERNDNSGIEGSTEFVTEDDGYGSDDEL